jgi:Flp pilus assembly protein TadD
MARADDALLCPACGARNKARWEFCARCGESLQGAATLVQKKVEAPKKAGPGERTKGSFKAEVSGGRAEGSALWAGLAVLALVATVIAGVWYSVQRGPAPTPPAAGLTIPTQPPNPAVATPKGVAAAQTLFLAGQRMLLAGDPQGALNSLAQAVAEAPENALYQYSYGEALVKIGSVDDGLAAMAEAARLDPGRYRLNYAMQLGLAGRKAEAVAEMQAIAEAAPDDAEALRGAGWYLCQQKDFARGLPLLRRAAELRQGDAGILDSLGAMQAANGDYKDAALTFGQIVLFQPQNREARAKLADSLLRSGRADQAIETLKKGVANEPSVPELQRDLAAMLERAGMPAEAAAAYRAYARSFPDAADAAVLLRKAEALAAGTAKRS